MKIKRELPQFENQSALLVITARQSADFYFAQKGSIEKVDSLEIMTPKYSDREGFFEKSGKGMTFASGAVYESHKQETREKFLNELVAKMRQLVKKYPGTTIYLFSPDYNLRLIQESLPQAIHKMIRFSFKGNYKKTHPFVLLKQIAAKLKEKAVTIPQ